MTWYVERTAWRIERVTNRWQLSRYVPATETWQRVGSYAEPGRRHPGRLRAAGGRIVSRPRSLVAGLYDSTSHLRILRRIIRSHWVVRTSAG